MSLEDITREIEMNDPELARNTFRNDGDIRMSTYAEADIPQSENHRIVSSTMDDWEQPNQVVCCEVE